MHDRKESRIQKKIGHKLPFYANEMRFRNTALHGSSGFFATMRHARTLRFIKLGSYRRRIDAEDLRRFVLQQIAIEIVQIE